MCAVASGQGPLQVPQALLRPPHVSPSTAARPAGDAIDFGTLGAMAATLNEVMVELLRSQEENRTLRRENEKLRHRLQARFAGPHGPRAGDRQRSLAWYTGSTTTVAANSAAAATDRGNDAPFRDDLMTALVTARDCEMQLIAVRESILTELRKIAHFESEFASLWEENTRLGWDLRDLQEHSKRLVRGQQRLGAYR